ncbi:MAG: 4Fe-4S binding protein [Deltaproteobacteria bacterium]|nr:4Fe-4S binding protein [Deltaproteobacteria bacterium]
MKTMRNIIEINEEKCDGCGQCVIACAEGAIRIIDGKARLISDQYCDGLGVCLGECPRDAISIIEREADEFNETAVEQHLKITKIEEPVMACGCPSTLIQSFPPSSTCGKAEDGALHKESPSALSHWPVQIRLVPPQAPFLKGADLLVAADCTPIAYPDFHRDFLQGKVVMTGCPKFDDNRDYIDKFTRIFEEADIKSITVLVMEVPCCQGLPVILQKAMERAGKEIPLEKIVIGTSGKIIKTESL